VALIGCGSPVCPAIQVPRSQVPKLVDQYAAERRAVVEDHPGLVVTPENEPRLVVEQRVEIPGEALPVTLPVEAPLGSARRDGDRLVLGRQEIRPNVSRSEPFTWRMAGFSAQRSF